jgi:hypothetical protein
MKFIKHIAVLATAALMIATSPSQAADSFSPVGVATAHQSVSINPATGVEYGSYFQLIGFNGDITNAAAPTLAGTNFIINPKNGKLQYMSVTNPINFSHATNVVSGTAWRLEILVNPGTVDRAVTYPASWNWATNKFDTNSINGKLAEYTIQAIGTNVLIKGQEFRP